MTESWEMEYQIACIAHGEEAAMWQTLRKNEATMEEVSYVLYGDEHLLKAVLDDPNWSGRILKQNPPDPAAMQAGFLPQGQHQPTMSGPMGTVAGPPVGQRSFWQKANPLSRRNDPMTAWQQDMEKVVGADAMRAQGMATAKPGWRQRMADTMSGWKENRAAAKEQKAAERAEYLERRGPGFLESLGDSARRRRAAKTAQLTGRSPAELEAREAGGEIDDATGEFVHPEAAVEEEAEAEDDAAAVREIAEGGDPATDELLWWAPQVGEAGYRKTNPRSRFKGFGKKTMGELGGLEGPTEGENIQDWAARTGATPGLVRRLQAHMEGGAHHGLEQGLFGEQGLMREGGWKHGFGASPPAGELPSDADVEGALLPDDFPSDASETVEAGADGVPVPVEGMDTLDVEQPEIETPTGSASSRLAALGEEMSAEEEGGESLDVEQPKGLLERVREEGQPSQKATDAMAMFDKVQENKRKREQLDTEEDLSELILSDDALNMAWDHLTMLKSNWNTSMQQYE